MHLPPPLTDTSDEGLRRAIEADLVATRLYNTDLVVEAHDEPDASWAVPPPGDLLRSAVVRTYFSDTDADRRIAEIVAAYDRHGSPLVWWVAPFHTPADLGDRLIGLGFSDVGPSQGMALDLATLPAQQEPLPAGLAIELVRDRAAIREYVEVVTQDRPEGAPPYTAALLDLTVDTVARRIGEQPAPSHFLGRIDGRAVATARLSVLGGTAGIYSVVTVAAARGRGIGRAMTLAALHAGRDAGYRIATLQSSPMGHRIYQRLTFRDVFDYQIFVRRPSRPDATLPPDPSLQPDPSLPRDQPAD